MSRPADGGAIRVASVPPTIPTCATSAPPAAGGTVSISGVYGGRLDPLPMMQIFDKGLQL